MKFQTCTQLAPTLAGFGARTLAAGTLRYDPLKIPPLTLGSRESTMRSQTSTELGQLPLFSAVDHSQVGADMIRIVFEAVRDASFYGEDCAGLPGISDSATGVRSGLLVDFTAGACRKRWNIHWVSEFTRVQTPANAAEALIATADGKVIRGGAMGGLNNEALARAVETAAGVLARHTSERVAWCKASTAKGAH